MAIRYLIEKELLQIRRNSFQPKIFVILPVIILLVVPFAANQEIKDLKFCVVDNDRSQLSRRLIERIDASGSFELTAVTSNYSSALRCVEDGSADVILEISNGFSSELLRSGNAVVSVNANAVNGVKGALGQSYMLSIIADFALSLRSENGVGAESAFKRGVEVRPRFLFNERLDYKVFMVPGVIAMLLMLLIGFLPALSIVGEKEKGTIERINVAPVSRSVFIISKLVPYWLAGLFMLMWSMLLAYLIYGLVPRSGVLSVVLFSSVFFLIMSSLGLIVSNYSSTMQQAALLMFFFLIIFVLMSGLLTPVSSMPQWAQYITCLNPLRYYIEAMRALYLKGSCVAELSSQLVAMSVFAVLSWLWAILSYHKTE